jgi:hypothetical protein
MGGRVIRKPPDSDFDDVGDDAKPRSQKLKHAEDLYTPVWVRGSGQLKEGFCDMCPEPGKWLQLKNSAFWCVLL